MKRVTSHLPKVGLVLALAAFFSPSGFGQGDLLPPPGQPAPTMRSLDQVAPRVIVNATNTPGNANHTFILSVPGSYCFAGNLTGDPGKNGISIEADDVTLDLNGFALISGGGEARRGVTGDGSRKNLCIRNGSVQGWGDGGIMTLTVNTLAENLRLANNAGGIGLFLGLRSIVRDCVASNNRTGFSCWGRVQFINCIATENTEDGFHSLEDVTIMDSTSSRNGRVGIWMEGNGTALRCTVSRNESDGFIASRSSIVADCTSGGNGSRGIYANDRSTVRNCTADGNRGAGIFARDDCYVFGNTCAANSSGGITASGTGNRIEANQCASNGGAGFNISANSLLVANSAHANSTNFIIQPTTAAGPIVDMTAGGTITSDSPSANFAY